MNRRAAVSAAARQPTVAGRTSKPSCSSTWLRLGQPRAGSSGVRGAVPAPALLLALICLALVSGKAWANNKTPHATNESATVILVVGAPGENEYGESFEKWAGLWGGASQQAGAHVITVGFSGRRNTNDFVQLQQALEAEPKDGPNELWLVLIGHGTFDGKEAKFNLPGSDLTATDLALWLQPFQRPVAVLNTASASGPFINQLSASNRVILTATRSGNEQNYARFGQYLAAAITDPQSDLDKDGQTSLLEAFLMASRQVAEFYKTEGRLATEHALLDDNGDGRGTPADWFRGIRAVKQAKDSALPDGLRAHQFHLVRSAADQQLSLALRAQRDALEHALARLRESKPQISEEEYYRRLETLLLKLARVYEGSRNEP